MCFEVVLPLIPQRFRELRQAKNHIILLINNLLLGVPGFCLLKKFNRTGKFALRSLINFYDHSVFYFQSLINFARLSAKEAEINLKQLPMFPLYVLIFNETRLTAHIKQNFQSVIYLARNSRETFPSTP